MRQWLYSTVDTNRIMQKSHIIVVKDMLDVSLQNTNNKNKYTANCKTYTANHKTDTAYHKMHMAYM